MTSYVSIIYQEFEIYRIRSNELTWAKWPLGALGWVDRSLTPPEVVRDELYHFQALYKRTVRLLERIR